jgi:hypothetical protein
LLASVRGRRLVVSGITVEEIVESAADQAAALDSLQRFVISDVRSGSRSGDLIVAPAAFAAALFCCYLVSPGGARG